MNDQAFIFIKLEPVTFSPMRHLRQKRRDLTTARSEVFALMAKEMIPCPHR
jgi:hypothetical protein